MSAVVCESQSLKHSANYNGSHLLMQTMATQIPGYASLVMLQISDHESFSLYCQYRNIGEWSRTHARRLFIRPDWESSRRTHLCRGFQLYLLTVVSVADQQFELAFGVTPFPAIHSWPPRVLAGLGRLVGI